MKFIRESDPHNSTFERHHIQCACADIAVIRGSTGNFFQAFLVYPRRTLCNHTQSKMANRQQFRNSIKIQRCRKDLVQGLDDVTIEDIVDCLLTESFIRNEDKNVIQAEKTEQDKARKLLDLIQRKVESQDKEYKSDLFDKFVECLREHNPSLALTVEKADDSVSNDKREIDDILKRVEGMELSQKMLNRILMYMGPGWESVATELGISDIKVGTAKENNPGNAHAQKFDIFNFWRQSEGYGRDGLAKLIKAIDRFSTVCGIDRKKILECIEENREQ